MHGPVRHQPVAIEDLDSRLGELGAGEHTLVVISPTLRTPFKHIQAVIECVAGMGVGSYKVKLRAGDSEKPYSRVSDLAADVHEVEEDSEPLEEQWERL
jgi:hypothetical protein